MRKLFILSIFCLFLISCSHFKQEHYICLRVCQDSNTVLSNSTLYTKQNVKIECEYFLVPKTNKYIEVVSVTSSDEDVLQVSYVDYKNNKVYILAKNPGVAKINIQTSSFYSSTSLPIHVN